MGSKYNEQELLNNAKVFFDDFFNNRIKKFQEKKISDLNANPFLIRSLAMALESQITPNSKAKALVYPFALGTSINTSFGTNIQKFIVDTVPDATGSLTQGMDIEFEDQIDGQKKYCQVKSGPQTINKDDIRGIENDFRKEINLAKTNHVRIGTDDLILGVVYGNHADLSSMYIQIEKDGYTVLSGSEFWEHLTGFHDFYDKLIEIAQGSAKRVKMKDALDALVLRAENYIKNNPSLF